MSFTQLLDGLKVAISAKMARKPNENDVGSLAFLLQQQAKKNPTRIALITEEAEISWHQLNARANHVAKQLREMGVERGDCVSLFMQNRIEFVACLVGINKLGAIAGLINTNLIRQPLTHCIDLIESKKCIFGEELLEPLSECLEDLSLKQGEDYLFVRDAGQSGPPDWARDLDLNESMTEISNPAEVDMQTLAERSMYVFTSGTTGLPKAAIVTNKRIVSTAKLSAQFLARIEQDDRIYNCLPLFHGTGLVVGLSSAFLVGASSVIRRRLSVSSFWEDIRKYQCTSFVYVGEFIRYLMSAPESSLDSDNPIRSIVGNGLRPDIWMSFKQRFEIDRIGEFYGGSEGNSGFANVFNKDCTVGCALSAAKLVRYDVANDEIIRDSQGFCIEAKDGDPGLLLLEINEKAKFEGYTSADASKSKVIENALKPGDSYFNTGDLMKTVDVGFGFFQKHYQFVDRVGDTFRWKSENVSTNEVGDIIGNFNQVLFANVYGVQIPQTDGRAGMAAIVLKEDLAFEDFDIDSFSEHVRESLPPYARPIFVRVLKELPTTTTHKLQKGELREQAYHLEKVEDQLLVIKPKEKNYTSLDQGFYNQLMQGHVSF